MVNYYPQKYTIGSGVGQSMHRLVAFDNALIDAGIADYNLVRISSILPANCQRAKLAEYPRKGSPLLTAYGSITTNEKGRMIASAVCAAVPEDINEVGVIMEYSGFCTKFEAEEKVKAMALEAMQNRKRNVREIVVSAIDCVLESDGYATVVSALSIW